MTHEYGSGASKHPLYNIWYLMVDRCSNPNSPNYPYYGSRGIRVCDRWTNSVFDFAADMGPRPGPEYSLERNDTNGHYEPGNCRWATATEQGRNKRNNTHVELDGRLVTVSEAAEILYARQVGVKHPLSLSTISQRLYSGWDVADVLVGQGFAFVEHNGQRRTLNDWATSHGMVLETLKLRLDGGMSMEEALTAPLRGVAQTYTHAGQTMTVVEWADYLGVSKRKLWWRLQQGWPIERVFA